jgi:hypothetical protein
VRHGNPWDLKGCRQKSGKSLQNYIYQFSRKYHKLPKIGDTDVISTFRSSTSYQTLVHELNRDQPKTTTELLDIVTWHASKEEAVAVIFI